MMGNYEYTTDSRGALYDDDRRTDATKYGPDMRDSVSSMAPRGGHARTNGVTFQDSVECVCGAKQHMQRLQQDIKRRGKQIDQDQSKVRNRFDELRKRERKLNDLEKELLLREEEMKSYKIYLQDKQHSISQMQQQNDAAQRELLQRLDECAVLEEECRRRLAEYESGLADVGKREAAVNETARSLNSRKDEIDRLEHTLLIETDRLKEVRDQCAAAREQVAQEVKQHRRRMEEEIEDVEAQKKKILDMENTFLDEKAAFDDYVRAKKRELEHRIKEVTDSNDASEAIANDLKKREDALNHDVQRLQTEREEIKLAREKIKAEWDKVNQALEEIRNAKSELKSIKRACTKQKRLFDDEIENQTRQLQTSASEHFHYNQSPIPHEAYMDIKQAEIELQTRAKEVELAAEELRAKQLELSEYAAQLKQREFTIKETERKLERYQDALDAREKELEELQAELMNTRNISQQQEAQMQEYKEQMALLAIERNSLEGQKAQFERHRLAKEAELNAARQRLERKEQELDDKIARYRGIKDSQQLENRIEVIRGAHPSKKGANRPFSIPPKNAGASRSNYSDHIA
ncbi:hypothetical protein, conserved [Babesia ovata]|uniref:Uncharacterized protein n=1 Tax=Babesia ovata TaxID=189622 RepID=A0A2H6KJB4_9APIC|nr:uncharacterized protein BOVATA_045710 [Babesia ovata]GBE63078.1 hypothetical protein, conserved [Babesia ovata]